MTPCKGFRRRVRPVKTHNVPASIQLESQSRWINELVVIDGHKSLERVTHKHDSFVVFQDRPVDGFRIAEFNSRNMVSIPVNQLYRDIRQVQSRDLTRKDQEQFTEGCAGNLTNFDPIIKRSNRCI